MPHSLATHHHVWSGPLDDGPGLSPVSAESDFSNVSPGYFPSRSGPRGRQAESSRSLGRPLLLRSDVAADAGVVDATEEEKEYVFPQGVMDRLAVQEALSDATHRRRKRKMDETAELDDGPDGKGPGRSGGRGSGGDEEGPSSGGGLSV